MNKTTFAATCIAALMTCSGVAFAELPTQFLSAYCISCHGPDEDKGDYVLHDFFTRQGDQWSVDVANIDNVYVLEDVLDQLNLGEMPPDKKDVKQPTSDEVRATRNWLTATLLTLEEDDRSNV
ncbi:MAG: c-type cytochrome domain-containing protein, partial [Planctomycetota bacterium]